MKVLFVSIYDPYVLASGPGNHLRNISETLRDLGCDVHVLACGSENRSRDVNGIKVHYFKSSFLGSVGKGFMFSLSSIGMINKICEEFGIDIVHGQSPSSFGYALLSKSDRPFVVTLHGTSFGEICSYSTVSLGSVSFGLVRDAVFVQPAWAFLTDKEYKRADRVVAVSKCIAQEAARFYRLSEDKIVTIHNGVNLPVLSDPPMKGQDTDHVILFVGRLVWRKGVKYLIDALPRVLGEYADTKLLIVGDGDQKGFLRERIKRFGIENSVQFLGRVSAERLCSLYHRAEVYVQPSLYEPFSIAILEAMSMAKPIVSTRVGGIPELITGGVEGLLVEPGNSLQLASAITNVFSDSSCRKRLGSNARKKVERELTWKAAAEKTIKLYKDMLNGGD